ncbi:MAG: hypothetical protein COB15_12425 [Flavobacteriales bacterium]|nr:MAG: hypothetical protein COB15_12425 [Flavobacteriales bacterium]
MTRFIIHLEQQEIANLLTLLETEILMMDDVFSEEEFILFTEKLLKQNLNLLKLLQKIDFSGSVDQLELLASKTNKKYKTARG